MLEAVALVLVMLWLLAVVTSTSLGGLIHILLAIAIVVMLLGAVQRRRLSQPKEIKT